MKQENQPIPTLANRLLEWALKPDLLEEILGDLAEKYEQQLNQKSPFKAKVNYWYQTLNYLRPFALRNNLITDLNPFFMWQHHFKLAFRNSVRDKSTFFINLIGLSTGLACTILIALWVMDEWQVDKFHEKENHLYRAMIHHDQSDGINTNDYTPGGLLDKALLEDFPEVKAATQESEAIPMPFLLTKNASKMKGFGRFVRPNFLDLMSYELVLGDRTKLFEGPQSIAISEGLALKLFDTEEAVGQTVEWEILGIKQKATVTGIFKKPGNNSTDQFDLLLPFQIYEGLINVQWGNYNAKTYVELQENTDVVALNSQLANYLKEKPGNEKETLFLERYANNYLYGTYENGQLAGGRIEYVRLFSLIAFFVLLIACINFMNLSTAKATRKLKEVGVRKTIGADRKSLIGQYFGESIFITFAALLIALILVRLFLPQFNLLTDKSLTFPVSLPILGSLFGITLLTGILAGSYPALYLSSFNPVKVLKGATNSSSGALWVRKALVVFQFVLSITFIAAVLVIYQQINFIQNKNLGYDKENILTFPNEGMASTNLTTFLNRLEQIPGIVSASSTSHTLMSGGSWTTGLDWEGKDPEATIKFSNIGVYYDFIETIGVEMLEGRTFSKAFGAEENNLILNETAVEVMGFTDPVGKVINLWGNKATIIGVVKDFHFQSLHEVVTPMFFKFNPEFLTTVMAKIEKGKEREVVQSLETFYQETNPGYDLNYSFLDTQFAAHYKAETRIAALAKYFAGLSIIISCLGLFGLVTFSAQRRQKEIGIRKVLGASTFSIVRMLSADFTKMVLVAIFIALPISYYAAQYWLEGFAFKITLQPWFFAVAGLGALGIAWLTVGLQTLRAANVNPTKSLKSE
ncbi:MAG: ABC transporter permease [Bacteroidota bacterium]